MSDNAMSPVSDSRVVDPTELAKFTPARVLVGRAGTGYRTATWLKLREDHAAARDAVHTELNWQESFPESLRDSFGLFGVSTRARSKAEFLMRPDLGRMLDAESRQTVLSDGTRDADVQVVIGDGLSASAVVSQVPQLLPLLHAEALARGWTFGRPFVVNYCRVGVMNEIGEWLNPAVVVLLIGERPGLATAESLSAYLAFRPRAGHTDAERNLISNIHARGVSTIDAAQRIANLAATMMTASTSGVAVKEIDVSQERQRLE